MNRSVWAMLVAGFLFGLSTADGNAGESHRHWHRGHHGKHARLYGHHKKHHHHRKHHKAPPPVVVAHVHVGSQTMTVDVMGERVGTWAVSTAGRGYHTPYGQFRAFRMARVYFSRKYDNSPMPNSVFFSGGNAIHGTYHIRSLGHPASHGCVRLLPQHAAELYNLVASYGMNRTRIVVSD